MSWSFVNFTSGENGAAATTVLTAFANTAGNALVLGGSASNGDINITSISDTAGNTWQAAPNATSGAGDKRATPRATLLRPDLMPLRAKR
jgi:hypothetical protein